MTKRVRSAGHAKPKEDPYATLLSQAEPLAAVGAQDKVSDPHIFWAPIKSMEPETKTLVKPKKQNTRMKTQLCTWIPSKHSQPILVDSSEDEEEPKEKQQDIVDLTRHCD